MPGYFQATGFIIGNWSLFKKVAVKYYICTKTVKFIYYLSFDSDKMGDKDTKKIGCIVESSNTLPVLKLNGGEELGGADICKYQIGGQCQLYLEKIVQKEGIVVCPIFEELYSSFKIQKGLYPKETNYIELSDTLQ